MHWARIREIGSEVEARRRDASYDPGGHIAELEAIRGEIARIRASVVEAAGA